MLRFLALFWDPAEKVVDAEAVQACATIASDAAWHLALKQSGVAVFVIADRRAARTSYFTLANGKGVVLGTVFEQSAEPLDETFQRVVRVSEDETERIAGQGPDRMIARYWGWYVAIVCGARDMGSWIMRSPMSDLPCFHMKRGGIHTCFSRVEDVLSLQDVQTTIDWPLIQLQVGFGQPGFMGQSAIKEISVLERGEALWITPRRASRRLHWNPCVFARLPLREDPRQVARLLRATVKRCVHSWAGEHEAVLLRLSGGLDSSLVLLCLACAPTEPSITCLNYFWDGRVTDERIYARDATKAAGAALRELRFGTSSRLDVFRHVRRTAAPVMDVIDWQESGREREIACATHATAIFTGSLGDCLFQRGATLSAAADHLQQHGLGGRFFQTLMNVALYEATSIWKVLRVAFQEAWLRPIKGSWSIQEAMLRNGMLKHNNVLVQDEVIASLREASVSRSHPWLQSVDGVPPGKLFQIGALFTDSFYDRHCVGQDSPPIVAPFLSQPLVELCLRIPSYLNVREGVDRAMAREAFADLLPTGILRRSSKGSPETWIRTMIERDARFVSEFLLDGILVSKRIVDKKKLESVLPGRISNRASHSGSVMNLLCTEAWLRSWSRC